MKRLGRVVSWLVVLALFGGLAWGWLERQAISDWLRLRDYEPTAAIAQLATDTTMNDTARRLFYVQHPELNDRATFNRSCGQIGEVTIVLGCYISDRGIHIFDVDEDPRLYGVEQVTAAHELLHAAYERLSDDERQRVDRLTKSAFESLTDERITQNVASYRARDPSVVPNELHSILATEVRELPPELEEYYRGYFGNRAQIVAYSESYEGELTARRDRAATLESQIAALKQDIDELERALITERSDLESERASVDTQAEVEVFNARVRSYNNDVGRLNDLIRRHNDLVTEYQTNALEQQELYEALNSHPTL